MYSPTYAELKAFVQKELDLEDETFITAEEILYYFNEAVDMVEAACHTIYEDYFLTSANLALVSGTQSYSLPSGIYAQKIRALLYDNGTTKKYAIRRIRKLEDTMFSDSTDAYRYVLTNAVTPAIKLYPTPAETNSTYVTIWYIRNALKFAADSDLCDIPEFSNVIVQFVKWKCLSKEGHPDAQQAGADLDRLRQEMVETLTARVPDEDNTVTEDYSFYLDFDNYLDGGMN